ncbi:NDP-hexose 2,3-dehydratase family protein [Micromonospora craniellae]|uniref:NDP-hexose 2,3-dehydratase family protein n=1 Tax=Micromonospora craniellae TaxID=2294034 RepID=UPI001313F407|nr:NDP-hexose 2,3-dehydratase family protein [Micromonospora craniellae]QOC91743.1 NDP-hexose 2,3-dehydratase family protein [Micromonospora craniellae]
MASRSVAAPSHLIKSRADQSLLDEIRRWREGMVRTRYARPSRLPLDAVPGWNTGVAEPAFTHGSGRFFAVRGHSVRTEDGRRAWMQPMVDQPEIGLLAIAVTPSDRGYAALVQAKAEPGNINGIQLSPTVQATRSNRERVHGGRPVPYLDLFDPATADVIVDSRQSEHGGVFWQKRNRVMIVRTPRFEPDVGFRWIELADLLALLHDDDLVHADTRAVLGCAPWTLPSGFAAAGARIPILPRTLSGAARCDVRPLARWLSAERARQSSVSVSVALPDLAGWGRSADALRRDDGTGFEVVAVSVDAAGREVDTWCQPMVRPVGLGVVGLAVCDRGGQLNLLMQACPEPGLVDDVELGPTVQIAGGEAPRSGAEADLLALLLDRPMEAVLFDAVLSDEGGRFLHSRCRHLVVLVDDCDAPVGFRWCPVSEVIAMLVHSHQVNMQARSALVCLVGAVAGEPLSRSEPVPRPAARTAA